MLTALLTSTLPSLLLFTANLHAPHVSAYVGTNAYQYDDGAHVVQDGTVNLVGFEGSVFHVINYLPVCGTFSNTYRYTFQIDLSEKCTFAMSAYNTTDSPDKTSGIYDLLGVEIEDPPEWVIGKGTTEVCICGSFSQGVGDGTGEDGTGSVDMCYWVDPSGFTETWWSLHTEERVASSLQRSSQNKRLPACKDVDLKQMLAESKAEREERADDMPTEEPPSDSESEPSSSSSPSSSGSSSRSSPTGTARGAKTSSTETPPPGEAPPEQQNSTLSTAKIWAPILACVCSITFGLIGLWWKRNDRKKRKEKEARNENKL